MSISTFFSQLLPSRLRSLSLISASHGSFAAKSYRLLIFADAVGPTLQINYLRPLSIMAKNGLLAMAICTEKSVTDAAARRQDLVPLLKETIAKFAPTVIIACRYAGPGADTLQEVSRDRGIPLLYHLDDDLLAIDPTDGNHKARHRDASRISNLQHLMRESSAIIVSTRQLAERLSGYGISDHRIILQEIAAAADPVAHPSLLTDSIGIVKFGYMGSRSHKSDLSLVVPAISQALQKHLHLRFELFGSIEMPDELKKFSCVHHARVNDYDLFLNRLAGLGWAFGLAPLRSTAFNLCKTNTKWVEYTAAGIPVLASDLAVYQGCITSKSGMLVADDAWPSAISHAASDSDWRKAAIASAHLDLVKNYNLTRMRNQLMRILQEI